MASQRVRAWAPRLRAGWLAQWAGLLHFSLSRNYFRLTQSGAECPWLRARRLDFRAIEGEKKTTTSRFCSVIPPRNASSVLGSSELLY